MSYAPAGAEDPITIGMARQQLREAQIFDLRLAHRVSVPGRKSPLISLY